MTSLGSLPRSTYLEPWEILQGVRSEKHKYESSKVDTKIVMQLQRGLRKLKLKLNLDLVALFLFPFHVASAFWIGGKMQQPHCNFGWQRALLQY